MIEGITVMEFENFQRRLNLSKDEYGIHCIRTKQRKVNQCRQIANSKKLNSKNCCQ